MACQYIWSLRMMEVCSFQVKVNRHATYVTNNPHTKRFCQDYHISHDRIFIYSFVLILKLFHLYILFEWADLQQWVLQSLHYSYACKWMSSSSCSPQVPVAHIGLCGRCSYLSKNTCISSCHSLCWEGRLFSQSSLMLSHTRETGHSKPRRDVRAEWGWKEQPAERQQFYHCHEGE